MSDWARKFKKQAGPPEEKPGAATQAGMATPAPGAGQEPQETPKQDSISDELPGENADPEGEFFGQGDMAQQGQRQPILDYTPCTWMAQQLEQSGEPLPQNAIAQTREGTILVSVEICRQCEWEKGCYGFNEDEEEKIEERRTLKTAAMARGLGIDPAMPELLVAEKIARLKFSHEEDAIRFLQKRGYTCDGAEYILRLSKSVNA